MAFTTIDDLLHAPAEMLLAAIAERQPRLNSIFNSPILLKTGVNYAQRALEDGAIAIEMPLIAPVEGGYTGQNPGTPPNIDNISSIRQKSPVFYREKAWGRDSFSMAQGGIGDPLNWVLDKVLNVRLDGMEDTLLSIHDGIFASDDFQDLILDADVNEDALNTPGDNVYFDADVFHDLTGILGIKEDDLAGGIITMHPKVRTKLKKLEENDFVPASKSQGIPFDTYKGLRVVVDDRLVRDGTTSGKVYPVTISAPQSTIMQLAPQGQDGTTASSLAFDSDIPNLRKALYDRIVGIVHVNGVIWTPTGPNPDLTIAKCGPTNVQLATEAAWNTAYTNVKETRIVRVEVNA
jgi:hypothetical protein